MLVRIIVILVVLIHTPHLCATEWTGNLNVFGGFVDLSTDFSPADDLHEFGFEIDIRPDWLPVSGVFEYISSSGANDYWHKTYKYSARHEFTEYQIGVRKIWNVRKAFHPFLGAGISRIELNVDFDSNNENYFSNDYCRTGVWFGAGVYYTVKRVLNCGVEAKIVSAECDDYYKPYEYSSGSNLGGGHLRGFIGFHF